MTHPVVRGTLIELALDPRRIDRRLDDLVHPLAEPAPARNGEVLAEPSERPRRSR